MYNAIYQILDSEINCPEIRSMKRNYQVFDGDFFYALLLIYDLYQLVVLSF